MKIGYWRADAMHEDVVEGITAMMLGGTLEDNIIGRYGNE